MSATVGQVMRHLNNFFETGYRATSYTITNGQLTPNDLVRPGMYIAITGSVFYDGVWQLGEGCTLGERAAGLPNETFFGRVWFLFPPREFLELCKNIEQFDQHMPADGLQSESFGEYSMTRASGKNGGLLTWDEQFKDALTPYRRMFSEVF